MVNLFKILSRITVVVVVCLSPVLSRAQAILFDAQINQFIEDLSAPIVKISGINPKFYLINKSEINAFATAESDIVLYTEIIRKSDTSGNILSVIAHEMGHIKAKHLIRKDQDEKDKIIPNIISGIGAIAAISAGQGGAGFGILTSGMTYNATNSAIFSQEYEKEADMLGINFLVKSGISPNVMVHLFNELSNQYSLYFGKPPLWLLSHPLPNERLTFIRSESSKYKNTNSMFIKKMDEQLPFIKAKLFALSFDYDFILKSTEGKTDLPTSYTKLVTFVRNGEAAKAKPLFDKLEKEAPKFLAPYLLEEKAYLAFNLGKKELSLEYLKKAIKLLPNNQLLALNLADAYYEIKDYKKALAYYNEILAIKPHWDFIYRSISFCYGKLGDPAFSHLYLAEYYYDNLEKKEFKEQLKLAEKFGAKFNKLEDLDFSSMLKDLKSRPSL